MSAFTVYDEHASVALPCRPFVIRDEFGRVVDSYRSRVIATSYCKPLNAGRANVHPHNTIGCRVEVLGYVS